MHGQQNPWRVVNVNLNNNKEEYSFKKKKNNKEEYHLVIINNNKQEYHLVIFNLTILFHSVCLQGYMCVICF